jgi:uncharacterized protein
VNIDAHSIAELLDWKRQVFALYADVRSASDSEATWKMWRAERDRLFATHPQSPLISGARADFDGLPYFEYDDTLRTLGDVTEAEPQRYEIATSGDGSYSFTRYATVSFEVDGEPQTLELYWLEGYGGGVFLPFRDATSGKETYGAGRYLLDTVKGADLGVERERLVLDFNFAYNPSCSYDPQWVCPLAPPPNRLNIPIRAGERYSENN